MAYLIYQLQETDTGAGEIVSTEEMKEFLELTDTDDYNAILASLVLTARKTIEQYTGLSLIEKDIVMYCESAPDEYFELRGCPYASDLVLKDEDGTVIAAGNYKTIGTTIKSIKYLSDIPFSIEYTTGQASDELLKTAIKVHAALLFEGRTGFFVSKENLSKTGLGWQTLAKGFRRPYKVL